LKSSGAATESEPGRVVAESVTTLYVVSTFRDENAFAPARKI
jgi:hypothetical protein